MILRGVIRDLDPLLKATIRARTLCLGTHRGFSIVVDTGFNGSISLPRSLIRRPRLRKEGFQIFRLADGKRVRLAMYSGDVLLRGRRIPAWFVPGEALVGMEFLTSVGSTLTLRLRDGTLTLR